MIAFDTNLLVRLVVDDHPAQADRAQQLLQTDSAFISRTVLLESEWVLRSVYALSPERILAFVRLLLRTENAIVESATDVARALDWYERGADFADALHLAVCGSTVMHTFDSNFCKHARKTGLAPAVKVWKV